MRTSEHGFLCRRNSGRALSGVVHRFVPAVPYDKQIRAAVTACGLTSDRFYVWEGPLPGHRMESPEQVVLNGWPPCRRCYPEFDWETYEELKAIDDWLLYEHLWNEQARSGRLTSDG